MVPQSVLKVNPKDLLEIRKVRIQFLDRCLAGIPKGGSALEYYIEKKFKSDDEKKQFRDRLAKGELGEDEKEEIKESSERVFERIGEAKTPCLWHGQLKAMLREVFSTIGLTQKSHSKVKDKEHAGGKQVLQHCVNVEPNYLVFQDGKGAVLAQPDGVEDRVVHPRGHVSALSSHEFMAQREMEFTLSWPKKSCFTDQDIQNALFHCEKDGLGACRSQGKGRFAVIKFDVV